MGIGRERGRATHLTARPWPRRWFAATRWPLTSSGAVRYCHSCRFVGDRWEWGLSGTATSADRGDPRRSSGQHRGRSRGWPAMPATCHWPVPAAGHKARRSQLTPTGWTSKPFWLLLEYWSARQDCKVRVSQGELSKLGVQILQVHRRRRTRWLCSRATGSSDRRSGWHARRAPWPVRSMSLRIESPRAFDDGGCEPTCNLGRGRTAGRLCRQESGLGSLRRCSADLPGRTTPRGVEQ